MCITGTACDAVRHPNKCDSHLRTHSDRSKCREYRTQWRHALHRPDTSPVPHRAERDELCPGRRFGTMQRLTIDGRHSGRQRAGKR